MKTMDFRPLLYRFAAPAAALSIFFAMSWLYGHAERALYLEILRWWGIVPFRFPFVDASGSLAAWECARHGINVIRADPCDVLQRSYSYSPLWMAFSAIPLGIKDAPIVGWITDLLFLSSLAALPRPRRPLELVLVLAATLSTMVVFAAERANPDILLFMMALATALLAEGSFAARACGYAIGLFAALLKYYPIMILVIIFRERPLRFFAVGIAIFLALATFGILYQKELAEGLPLIPTGPYFTDLFGAKNLPSLLGQLVASALSPAPPAALLGRISRDATYLFLVVAVVQFCRRLLGWAEFRADLSRLAEREHILLVIGSAVIAGCFFAGQSIGYRGVYFLLVLPGLLAAARGAQRRGVRRLLVYTGVVIVILMWEECVRRAFDHFLAQAAFPAIAAWWLKFAFFFVRELAWWSIVSILASVLIDFLMRSEIWATKGSLFRRIAPSSEGEAECTNTTANSIATMPPLPYAQRAQS